VGFNSAFKGLILRTEMNCRWEVWEVWEDMFITSTYSVTPIMCVPVAYIFHNFLWPDARLTRFSI